MVDLSGIKNIIFDLGNVVIDIDFNLTVNAFQALGGNNLDLNLENYMDHSIFGAIEKGEISPAQFRQEIRHLLQEDLSDTTIDQAWAAVIKDTNHQRINLIHTLSKDYRLFILSNTDAIHIAQAQSVFSSKYNVDMEKMFEKCYYSYQMMMSKPGLEIYKAVLNDAQIKAKETLFIDDKKDNVEAALTLGIQAYWLDIQRESLTSIF